MAVIDIGVDSPEARVLDAARRCIGRWGVGKTTLDDVAREAGCSRATVYRLFPGGRDAVVAGVVAGEVRRFAATLEARLEGLTDLEELLVAGMTHASRFLAEHEALQYLLAHEAELILPRISFAGMRDVLVAAARIAAPYLERFTGEEEARRAGEWLARIVISYTVAPADGVDMRDEEHVRSLVRRFVLPGLARHVHQQRG